MNIITSETRNPTPNRNVDWQATIGEYDEGALVGYGATPELATEDLLQQVEWKMRTYTIEDKNCKAFKIAALCAVFFMQGKEKECAAHFDTSTFGFTLGIKEAIHATIKELIEERKQNEASYKATV